MSAEMRRQRGGAPARQQGPETMLDAARRLVTPSARSDVPAFMVMDVMAAAARIEAAGARVIHLEVGQPAASAPASAIAAARAALGSGRLGYTETLGHSDVARENRAALSRDLRALRSIRRASSSPPDRRPDSSWLSSRCSSPAIGSRSRCRAIRPIGISSARSAASRWRSRRRGRRAGRSRRRCSWRRIARRRSRAC